MKPPWPTGWRLEVLDRQTDPSAPLDQAAAEIFGLFAEREQAFGVNPRVIIDIPDIADPASSPFLTDPSGYLVRRVRALDAEAAPIVRVVVLTTYSQRLRAALLAAGYTHTPIDMPAGPDGTGMFARTLPGQGGRTLYVEAVNEADEKIRPSFALRLWDGAGTLAGGACGSVHTHAGVRFAWLATLAVRAGLPAGTGTALAEAMMSHLRQRQVHTLYLGTQTADAFYRQLGFATRLTVLPALRHRQGAGGRRLTHDLVMMEKRL